VRGVFFLTQKLVPLARDRGRILNVPSGFVRFVFPRKIAYASMHWINGESMHWINGERIEASRDTRKMELQPRGITSSTGRVPAHALFVPAITGAGKRRPL